MSGNFLSCIKGVEYCFEFQEERWDSLKMLQWERTSSCVEGRIPWFSSRLVSKLGFLSSCDVDLRVPLILPLGNHVSYRVVKAPQDASQVTAGKVGLI